MEPTLIEMEQILLVGLSFFGDPFSLSGEWTEENEIGRLWQRFFVYIAARPPHLAHVVNAEQAYEVHIEHAETPQKGHYEVFVGQAVTQLKDVPVEFLVKILPAATYAVFHLTGQQIVSDWSKIMQEWMRAAGYQSAGKYGFQLYDRRFKGMDRLDESELDAYVPIMPCHPVESRS